MTSPVDYRQAVAEDQRLAILSALAAATDYTLPAPTLRRTLEAHGHRVSAEILYSHLAWLDARPEPLITLMGEAVKIARLTVRGEDVAQGRTREPGVARPAP